VRFGRNKTELIESEQIFANSSGVPPTPSLPFSGQKAFIFFQIIFSGLKTTF
jgi:hypothetical protein